MKYLFRLKGNHGIFKPSGRTPDKIVGLLWPKMFLMP